MALDLNRWIEYAKARVTSAVGKGNEELDRLEAEREVELADKPWLASDGEAPTLDEAKARIEWEAAEQQRRADERAADPTAVPVSDPVADVLDSAEGQQARVELEARQKEAAARLDEIRRELGVADPPEPNDPDAPKP